MNETDLWEIRQMAKAGKYRKAVDELRRQHDAKAFYGILTRAAARGIAETRRTGDAVATKSISLAFGELFKRYFPGADPLVLEEISRWNRDHAREMKSVSAGEWSAYVAQVQRADFARRMFYGGKRRWRT